MDTLTTMRTDVNGIGRDQLIQTQQIGQGICQGFGGIATEIANLGSQLSQGQCRTEAAVLTTGLNGQIQQKDNTIAQLNAAHAVEMQGHEEYLRYREFPEKTAAARPMQTSNGRAARPAMKCRARPRSFSQRFVTARRPPLAVHPPKSSL